MAELTKLKQTRSIQRTAFTKALTSFDGKFAANSTLSDLKAVFDFLQRKMDDLTKTSDKVIEMLNADDTTKDEDILKYMEDGDQCTCKFFATKNKLPDREAALLQFQDPKFQTITSNNRIITFPKSSS